MDFVYRFPVVKGIQAKREYYIAMVPMKMISKLFAPDEEYVSPEYRAQRRLNEARVPIISKYILDNKDTYVFSALAASIDGKYVFIPASEDSDIGILEVSLDARFLINDGQHRKAAILEALQEDESLGEETISIVFFADKGLARSQQIFTDLNKNAVRTSNSISELYDSRDKLAVITRNAVKDNDFLDHYTDKEKDILGKYSSNLFTLNTFYSANKAIIGRFGIDKTTERFVKRFWNTVTQNMIPWKELQAKEITKVDLRENYIATQAIVIQALGRVGNHLYLHQEDCPIESLQGLKSINWRRNAQVWQFRAIKPNGRIITSKKAAILIANELKKQLEIPLNDVERTAEEEFLKSVRSE